LKSRPYLFSFLLLQALGKVLFIDEAYMLNPKRGPSFGGECLDEIVKNLTHQDFKGKLAVILAGYESDMDDLLKANQGLRSRFSERIKFKDMTEDTIAKTLIAKLKEKERELDKQARDALPSLAVKLKATPDFGNGRDVENWCRMIVQQCALNSSDKATVADLQKGLEQLLRTKGSSETGQTTATPPTLPAQIQTQTQTSSASAAPPPVLETIKSVEPKKEPSVLQSLLLRMLQPLPTPPNSSIEDNPFKGLDPAMLKSLQTVLEANGLNSDAGVQKVTKMSPAELTSFAYDLAKEMNVPLQVALDHLNKWKDAVKSLGELRAKVEAEVKSKKRQAIWRCAVCGRANLPFIVCYVAPYIVGYQAVAD
jgi:hypothetical protein